MKIPTAGEVFELGIRLERLVERMLQGDVPTGDEVLPILALGVVMWADVDELKPFIGDAEKARQDLFTELEAEKKLGPRP